MTTVRTAAVVASLVGALVVAGNWRAPTYAQSFESGSDGSDGDLNLAGGLGPIVFDPNDTDLPWKRVLDADGDGVYNFTAITIGSGTTLRMTADKVVRPIYWLASGAVAIAGAIDLSGAQGAAGADIAIRRQLATPGSGGFAGGSGALPGAPVIATAGDGPGGGPGAAISCQGAGEHRCGAGGKFSGNRYLIPLVGGSGGGGGRWTNGNYYNGGAGGGAILIASSTSINVSGAIYANGGDGASALGGGGSGGAIRLVAPTMAGGGQLHVNGGAGTSEVTGGLTGRGAAGMVRLERFTQTGTFYTPAGGLFLTVGSPVDTETLRPSGSVRVTAVAGVPVPPTAAGSFVLPDVTISGAGAVPVEVEASGVPPGTSVTLSVYPQSPDDGSTIFLPPVTVTLTGTLERSTATINFVFPYGYSRGTLRATW